MIKGKHHGPPAQSVCSNVLRSSPSSPCSLVGRYYDPATGQFLSVDPMVAETGQAYAYTGDDPVNAVDPLGLVPDCGGQVGSCVERSPGRPEVSCAPYQSSLVRSEALTTLRIALLDGAGHLVDTGTGGIVGYSKYLNHIGENSLHASDETLYDLANTSDAADTFGRSVAILGAGITFGNDIANGHGVAYAAGDAATQTGGAYGGAVAGTLLCGGPEDGIGIVCGAIGGFLGGGGAHWIYSKLV